MSKNKNFTTLIAPQRFSVWALAGFVCVFIIAGALLLLGAFASTPTIALLQGEQMVLPAGASVVSDSAASGGKAVRMTQNGYLSGQVNLPSTATSMSVVAKAGGSCRETAAIKAYIDNQVVIKSTAIKSSSYTSVSASNLSLGAGNHSVKIYLSNPNVHCSHVLYVDVANFYGPTPPPPVPTVSLSVTPTTATAGTTATLNWISANASSCLASGGWSGAMPTSGSVSTGALNATSTYSLTCTGSGGSANASATVTVSANSNSNKPIVVGHQLNSGDSGTRLKMKGVAVWGIQDQITGSFGVNEYTNRQAIVNTIKSWGGNEIRLRVLASDYNNQTYMSQAKELQEIKDWQATAQAAGLYLSVTWWDALDGPYHDASWAANYSKAFPMMTAVINTLGPTNPWVFYEPFNEPNSVSESSWLAAMVGTDQMYRTAGYKGILLMDTNGWSHVYNDADMTTLENNDAAFLKSQSQIIFAKHDYANEFPNPNSFDMNSWLNNDDGSSSWNTSKHLVWETEFGNYNGSPSTVHTTWSSGAASAMASYVNNGTLVGASAFVFGPWYDANAMTNSDNATPTQWGGYVKGNFLGAVN